MEVELRKVKRNKPQPNHNFCHRQNYYYGGNYDKKRLRKEIQIVPRRGDDERVPRDARRYLRVCGEETDQPESRQALLHPLYLLHTKAMRDRLSVKRPFYEVPFQTETQDLTSLYPKISASQWIFYR